MAKQPPDKVLQFLRNMAAVHTNRELSDSELLERFAVGKEEAAFTILIERHGPMVLNVCRRALSNSHDAEDACQAAFLVLIRKAVSIRKKTSLSSWLHGVAYRVAAKMKQNYARQTNRELGSAVITQKDPAAELTWREMQAILDEELQRLPERYRSPLILCYLECMTRDQAAQQLGLSLGGLHGRLERARDMLRERLIRKGLALSAVMFANALGETVSAVAMSPIFVVSLTKAATLLATGYPLPEAVVSNNVLALTKEILNNMFLTKLKFGTAAALCAVLFVAMISGSFISLSIAQDAKPNSTPQNVLRDPATSKQSESDLDFIKRISNDLRGTNPTSTEIHFFVASKDTEKRRKLIDLFIQERKLRQKALSDAKQLQELEMILPDGGNTLDGAKLTQAYLDRIVHSGLTEMGVKLMKTSLESLQKEFYQELQAAKSKVDVAKITQAHLDRLITFATTDAQSQDVPEAMRQIVVIYESQGKTVEAAAWRAKLQK